MSDPKRNAAIWFAKDAYDPAEKGINGRRVVGASFLRGFGRHADVDEFTVLSGTANEARDFATKVEAKARGIKVRHVPLRNPHKIAPVGAVHYAAPNFAEESWRRQTFGAASYSITGVTHTTATKAVMEGAMQLRLSPSQQWDAVICTSKAVLSSMQYLYDGVDEYLISRFGALPPRPQMPVIPLGINTDEFARDAKARNRIRKRMDWTKDDIVISTLARLVPYGKFDPAPVFIALERAQANLGTSKRLHFVACGIYADGHSEKVFTECARALMPSVSYTHLDGADSAARQEALSGADIFTFPIDNVQETFGLAPIEAMAAGLPVVVTDWDGMKDTVTQEVGIRVPTRTPGGSHTLNDARNYNWGRLSYAQYGNALSAITEVDMTAMVEAFAGLASNDALRRTMGAAGLKRAQEVFDWRVIVPQMQDLWGELVAIRTRASDIHRKPAPQSPRLPSPMHVFADYPTEQVPRGVERCVAVPGAKSPKEIFALRRYGSIKQPFEQLEHIDRVMEKIRAAKDAGADATEVAAALKFSILTVDRIFMCLLKFGLITRKGA